MIYETTEDRLNEGRVMKLMADYNGFDRMKPA